jgi:hypothetical protein
MSGVYDFVWFCGVKDSRAFSCAVLWCQGDMSGVYCEILGLFTLDI